MSPPHASPDFDVGVIGGGPAALAIAGAIARARPQATMAIFASPHPRDTRFGNNFGAFARAVPQYCSEAAAFTYPKTHVAFAGQPERVIDEAYIRFDSAKLAKLLFAPLEKATVVVAQVEAVHLDTNAQRLEFSGRDPVRVRLLIDATGFYSPFLRRQSELKTPYVQRAYGHIIRTDRPLFDPNAMRLMDFTPAPNVPGVALPHPTFLYAMPLEPDGETHRVFVEETQLTGTHAAPFDALAATLQARLDVLASTRGIEILGAEDTLVEHCHILMNRPLPRFDQNLLGFGAAASFVNPASGYSLATTLSRAERAAGAIAQWLARPDDERPPAFTLWSSLWTERELGAQDFYAKGGAILATFDQKDLVAFQSAFFKLPDDACFRFLTRDMDYNELLRCGLAMSRHFSFGLKGRFLARFAKESTRARG